MPSPRTGKWLMTPVDVHEDKLLGEKISDSDDDGINSTVKYGAWFRLQ